MHLTPKYFSCLNKIFASVLKTLSFCPFLNQILTFLQAAKVTKSGHHLFHDRASKGDGSIPGITSQTSLHARLQGPTTMQIRL